MFDGQFSHDLEQSTLETVFAQALGQVLQDGTSTLHTSRHGDAGALVHHVLDWDSTTFGLKMERIDHVFTQGAAACKDLIENYLLAAQERGVQHISVRVGDDNLGLQQGLVKAGFEILGSKSMLRLAPPSARTSVATPGGVMITTLQPEDMDSLSLLVSGNIEINRFSSDPHIESAKVSLVYEGWFQNLAKAQPENIFVARSDGAVGVAACSAGIPLYGNIDLGLLLPGFVGLFAVDHAYRGRGIGRALLEVATNNLLTAGCNVLFANTDRRNPSSLRAFKNAGFEAFSGFSELRWFGAQR